jgi:hypothetical protein
MRDQAKPALLLHIGWPKTATTYLQLHVFPETPGVHYLGKDFPTEDWWTIERAVQVATDEEFANQLDGYQDYVRSQLSAEKLNVLSQEGFTRAGRYTPKKQVALTRTFTRLHRLFGRVSDLSVLALTRSPRAMLNSYLNQFSNEIDVYGITPQTVARTLDGTSVHLPTRNVLDTFLYRQYEDWWKEKLNVGSVTFLPYENFQSDYTVLNECVREMTGKNVEFTFPKTSVNKSGKNKKLDRLRKIARPENFHKLFDAKKLRYYKRFFLKKNVVGFDENFFAQQAEAIDRYYDNSNRY